MRKFLKKIEVYKNVNQADNSGGYTFAEVLLGDSWCNIETLKINHLKDYGLNANTKGVMISLRHRADIDYEQDGLFFRYKSKDYYPSVIIQEGLEEDYLSILATSR